MNFAAGWWFGPADPGQLVRRREPESEPAGELQPLGGGPRDDAADDGAGDAGPVLRVGRVRGAPRGADGRHGAAAAAGLHAAAADDDGGAGGRRPPPDADAGAAEPREPVRQPPSPPPARTPTAPPACRSTPGPATPTRGSSSHRILVA